LLVYFSRTAFKIAFDDPTKDPNAPVQYTVDLTNLDYTSTLMVEPDKIYFDYLEIPERTGSVFDGWFTEDGTRITYSTHTPDQDISLTAAWSKSQTIVQIPIINFEHFIDDATQSNEVSAYSISELTKLLNYVKENNYYYPNWKELSSYINGKANLPEKSVIFTVNRSDYSTNVLLKQILDQYCVQFTVMLITNPEISDYNMNGTFAAPTSWYIRFGTQGTNLANKIYDDLPQTALWRTERIAQDLEASFSLVNSKQVFAYPEGLVTPNAKQALIDTNFHLALTFEPGYVTPGLDPLEIPQFKITDNEPAKKIIERILLPALD
jgi:uncharacterized repeat protein (TIGR02543 family)